MSDDVPAEAPKPPAAPEPPELEHPLEGPARWLAAHGGGPRLLAVVGLVLAALAGLVLVIGHAGLAGIIGLIAVLAAELARMPQDEDGLHPDRPASALAQLVDLTIGAALVAVAAHEGSALLVALALGVLGVLAWLPFVDVSAPAETNGGRIGLWRRPNRLVVLTLGLVLGHPMLSQLLVLAAGILDGWLRVARLVRPDEGPAAGLPPFLGSLMRPDGSIHPVVRWGSLLVVVLLFLVLPRGGGWQF
jgi:hypothetical protein